MNFKNWQMTYAMSIFLSSVVTTSKMTSDIFINANLCFLWVSFFKLLTPIAMMEQKKKNYYSFDVALD